MKYTARLIPVTGDRPIKAFSNSLPEMELWAGKVLAAADDPTASVEITETVEVPRQWWTKGEKKGDPARREIVVDKNAIASVE
jgi:hypothetical protein